MNKEPEKAKTVVSCILYFGNKVMLARRLKKTLSWGFYETTSGKREKEESITSCIQREIIEESGLFVPSWELELLDCYTDSPFCDKLFIYRRNSCNQLEDFRDVKNPEPDKRTKWQLYTREEAKKLKLMPHLLENI